MEQANLWQTHARCLGLTFKYELAYKDADLVGLLDIVPRWSKRPKASGEVHLRLDECANDLVPELFREAWDGFLSTDPGYYIPRWVKGHLQDYENASRSKLQD